MAQRKSNVRFWWQALAMTILVGLGYAGLVSFNWDRLVGLGNGGQQQYSEKDLLQCEPGMHQQNGRCVSNSMPSSTPSTATETAAPPSK